MTRLLRAQVHDLIVIAGHRPGESRRLGEILEVIGSAENEHYRVQWDDGHESIYTLGCDAVIQHASPRRAETRKDAA